jgi:hydroxymethylpyrimidine pyrophosphatase-like HAD family hydrolase
MKLSALALDYDGTIAVDGVFDPAVRAAIGAVRRQGVVVILATGRRISELRQVAGDLTCFDAIVAENGAVLEFPMSGRHVVLGHRPNPAFLRELQRHGVPFASGESVVELDARWAEQALRIIRSQEQPLILSFNRDRLMILPPAVAKSTGLRQALSAHRISIHNTVGIGDAENDHDLLDACEVGVAVGWGSAALRAAADEVIAGSGPPAVAEYIERLSKQPRLSASQMGRRRLLLGYQHNGQEVSLAVRGRTMLIAGEPGTGKSWLGGLICEQSILQGYCVCIVDPEGDYRSLETLPGVMTLGGDDPPPQARELAEALRHPDVSVIIDLSKVTHQARREYMRTLLPSLVMLRRQTGLPHKILLDEAHYFLGNTHASRFIDADLAGYVLVTYRVSALPPAIRNTTDAVVMVTRETDPEEARTLLAMCRPQPCEGAVLPAAFRDLQAGEAAVLPGAEEAHGQVRRFKLAPRLTEHVRHRLKYLDMPVLDSQAFVFTGAGRSGLRAHTLKELTGLLTVLPDECLAGHLRRHDFSRWLEDVFRDRGLATHLRSIERRAGTDEAREVAEAIAQAIRSRYETAPDARAHI